MNNVSSEAFVKGWKSIFFEGIAFVILGVIALSVPHYFSMALAILFATLLLVGGVIQLLSLFNSDSGMVFVFTLISAILLLAAGVVLLIHPVYSVIGLTMLISVYLFAHGVVQIFSSFAMRSLGAWLWLFLSGVIAILLAVILWLNWPVNMVPFLGIIFGIYLLVFGIAKTLVSFSVRSYVKSQKGA